MKRSVIFTADDFGMSIEVNEAVEEAHRKGVLTCASLVTAGAASEDAVRRARRMPDLGVGLHLALYGAPAQAPPDAIPGLLNRKGGGLGERPMVTGALLALSARLQAQARREIEAQFRAFASSGLALSHLDGHWHCHQHPFILGTAIELGRPLGLRAVRVPYEPPLISWRAAGRRQLRRRATDAWAHRGLAANMRRVLGSAGLAYNHWFFGKNDGGAMVLGRLLPLISLLPGGVSEVGLHPARSRWQDRHAPPSHWRPEDELAALLDPALREACHRHGVGLTRFSDLAAT